MWATTVLKGANCAEKLAADNLGLGRVCKLAQEIFFHRERTQPLTVTQSRSHPAYYITPELLAHIVGLSMGRHGRGVLSDAELDAELQTLGVVSHFGCSVDTVLG